MGAVLGRKPTTMPDHQTSSRGSAGIDVPASTSSVESSSLPAITEDDLFNFQYAHFGDDSRPAEWFVSAETALNFHTNQTADDDLGFYPDGVKRTLTDANIAFFRGRERHEMAEAARRKQEEDAEQDHKSDHSGGDRRRASDQGVPYAERNKRKWEQYIDGKDAVQGSLTHRRMARELDDQKTQSIDMDY